MQYHPESRTDGADWESASRRLFVVMALKMPFGLYAHVPATFLRRSRSDIALYQAGGLREPRAGRRYPSPPRSAPSAGACAFTNEQPLDHSRFMSGIEHN